MKETSGLSADAVFDSQPYLKNKPVVEKRKDDKLVELMRQLESGAKEERALSEAERCPETYQVRGKKPGTEKLKEDGPGGGPSGPDPYGRAPRPPREKEEKPTDNPYETIANEVASRARDLLRSKYEIEDEDKIEQGVASLLEKLVESDAHKYTLGRLEQALDPIATSLKISADYKVASEDKNIDTREIRRSRGEFDDDEEFANIVTKAMGDRAEKSFEEDKNLAKNIAEEMEFLNSPVIKWNRTFDPPKDVIEEYTAKVGDNDVKGSVLFFERVQKGKEHYSVRLEANGLIMDKHVDTLSEARNYLNSEREYTINKYFYINEPNKPIPSLHVLYDAYKKVYDASTDEFRKKALEEKLQKIRERLDLKPDIEKETTFYDPVKKTMVDDVAEAKWDDLHKIVKMRTYKDDYVKLIEHGIYDKDGKLADYEKINEFKDYYTREGEKIPSDDVKAVREILATGVYSQMWLKKRPNVIV